MSSLNWLTKRELFMKPLHVKRRFSKWELCNWSLDLRLPWDLIHMNSYFSLYSLMTKSWEGCFGYGELCMKIMSLVNKESITPGKRSYHPELSHQMMTQKVFNQSIRKLEMVSNTFLIESSLARWDPYE